MALSNTATPIYYGQFKAAVIRGEIPGNRYLSMEMNRIEQLIDDPDIYYDDLAVNGFIRFCEQGSVNEDNFAQWRSIPVMDAAFDDVSLTKNGDAMYALEREIANSPENGIPALCAVSAELSTQFQTIREKLIYNTSLSVKDELQALQDQMQLQLETK